MNNNSHPSKKFSSSINPDLEEKIPESLKSESFMLLATGTTGGSSNKTADQSKLRFQGQCK